MGTSSMICAPSVCLLWSLDRQSMLCRSCNNTWTWELSLCICGSQRDMGLGSTSRIRLQHRRNTHRMPGIGRISEPRDLACTCNSAKIRPFCRRENFRKLCVPLSLNSTWSCPGSHGAAFWVLAYFLIATTPQLPSSPPLITYSYHFYPFGSFWNSCHLYLLSHLICLV